MRITTLEYRQQGIVKLLSTRQQLPVEFYNSIDYAIEMLNEPILDSNTIETGKRFIEQSDRYRNKNIKDYVPELYNELWN
jgi:hypothetical protein